MLLMPVFVLRSSATSRKLISVKPKRLKFLLKHKLLMIALAAILLAI
jgi:hypothetical protein